LIRPVLFLGSHFTALFGAAAATFGTFFTVVILMFGTLAGTPFANLRT
jgi:hypothetical protein